MGFQITSATSTNVVRLGQSRQEVRGCLGAYGTFRRTPQSEESDHFVESGVMATYSDSGTLVMLEFVAPAQVDVDGVQLLGEPLKAVEEILGARGVQLEADDLGAVIPSLSIKIFAPEGVVEGVQLGSD